MDIKIIYEDKDVLVVDKPAGIVVFNEIVPTKPRSDDSRLQSEILDGEAIGTSPQAPRNDGTPQTLIGALIKEYPELKAAGDQPRYGIVHRLDKDTSGILLIAKNNEALIFLQKQFSPYGGSSEGGINTLEKKAEKRYIALVEGNIKNDGEIRTFLARSSRDPRKQTVYQLNEPAPKSAREAITEYKVLERFTQSNNSAEGGIAAKRHLTRVKDYTLLEVKIKTGRRHQIRCHFSYLQHPIAGDKLYGFKNSKAPEGLTRQFLHAFYLKIKLPNGEVKEFTSELPEELQNVLSKLT